MATLAPTSTPDGALDQMRARIQPITPAQLAWRRFLRHKGAVVGAIGATLIALFIVAGSILVPVDQSVRPDALNILSGPTWLLDKPAKVTHLFGTDQVGRDVFARILYGGQISLTIAVLSLSLGTLVGIFVGGVAGYFGGWIDAVLMRLTEAILSIPQLFLLIVLGKLFAPKIPNIFFLGRSISGSVVVVILVIGFTSWMYGARIVRASILSLRERDYVSASQALGANRFRVLFTHLIPNTIAPIIVTATLGLVNAITTEAYVSFLGLGVQDPPTASWGNMISQSLNHMQRTPPVWWMWFFPGLFITLTVLFINFIGDGLRDALDPRRKV
jgi:peptide/nickel transport system permease protein